MAAKPTRVRFPPMLPSLLAGTRSGMFMLIDPHELHLACPKAPEAVKRTAD